MEQVWILKLFALNNKKKLCIILNSTIYYNPL